MKVLFVSTLYYPNNIGGAEATVRMLAEALVARGHAATVVSLAPDGKASMAHVGGVKVIYVPLANLYFPHGSAPPPGWLRFLWHVIDAYNPAMGRRLGRIIDDERPDVVNVHNPQGFSVAAWRAAVLRGIPVVQTLHDYYTGCSNSSMYRGGRICTKACAPCKTLGGARRRLSRQVSIVTTVSRRTFDLIKAAGVYTGVADVRVIQNCIYDQDRRTRPPVPADGQPLVLGFLGRIDRLKGLEVMLDTVRRFPRERVVAIVGGQGDSEYLAELRREYAGPQVEFRGWVDPNAFFADADLLVVPSLWEEPLPRVCHEAMAHGVPIIASRTGGLPEIVQDGETGFLFDVGDRDDLERVLRRFVGGDPGWTGLSDNSRRNAVGFRLDRIFEQYWSAWTAAASSSRTIRQAVMTPLGSDDGLADKRLESQS